LFLGPFLRQEISKILNSGFQLDDIFTHRLDVVVLYRRLDVV